MTIWATKIIIFNINSFINNPSINGLNALYVKSEK